ncbi:MAG: hypothetical protein HY903_08335 [Deltaproteobacteria bacterium]|nr:hypothetical protein [Deltaproteobacteria bacterium]
MFRRAMMLAWALTALACDRGVTATSVNTEPPPECGNDVRRDVEQCDGTDVAGRSCTSVGYEGGTLGCSSDCLFDTSACTGVGPACGNGSAEGPEQCDAADLNAATCRTLGFDGGTLSCGVGCTFDTSACTGSGSVCGDANAVGLEECDGIDLRQLDCAALGFNGGVLVCDATCRLVTGGCSGTAPFCGDGSAQGLEQCDAADTNGLGCVELGYTSGTLACQPDCRFDTTACVGTPAVCGDTVKNGLEECDAADLGGRGCQDLGYTGGTLACDNSCSYDPRGCTLPACQNGTKEPGEDCDGTDFGNATCVDLGHGAGTLACTASCTFDTSGCTTPSCGDGAVNQAVEQCDGSDLAGTRCRDLTFQGGTLLCTQGCTFNTLLCFGSTATCGDGVRDLSEGCEGADFGAATCQSEGFTGGTLTCTACRIDSSTCTGTGPVCPNNVAEGDEMCDGTDLRGTTCTDLGFTGGTLGCNTACIFDVSGCNLTPICGNNRADWPEICDGADLRGQSCQSLNAGTGTLACSPTCDGYDFTGCSAAPVCGNDQIDALEICDGTDLGLAVNCLFFGYNDATSAISCLPTCGGYDLSSCTNPPTRCGNGRAQGNEQCDGSAMRGATCRILGYASGDLTCNTNCSFNVSACVP